MAIPSNVVAITGKLYVEVVRCAIASILVLVAVRSSGSSLQSARFDFGLCLDEHDYRGPKIAQA